MLWSLYSLSLKSTPSAAAIVLHSELHRQKHVGIRLHKDTVQHQIGDDSDSDDSAADMDEAAQVSLGEVTQIIMEPCSRKAVCLFACH